MQAKAVDRVRVMMEVYLSGNEDAGDNGYNQQPGCDGETFVKLGGKFLDMRGWRRVIAQAQQREEYQGQHHGWYGGQHHVTNVLK